MANDYIPTLDATFKFSPEVAAQIAGDAFLPAPFTASIAGAYTIDATKPVQILTVTGDVTITVPAVPADATTPLTVIVVQDATGGHVVTLPTAASAVPVKWPQGVAPTLATTANTEAWLYLVGAAGLGWRGFVSGTGMA